MKLKELLMHFDITDELPGYLLEESFNSIFLDGDFSKKDNSYKISITTRQDVTHQMFIKPDDDFPVVVMSKLPNGRLNGIKFGRKKGQLIYTDKL